MATVTITKVSGSSLYHRYRGQIEPQPVYVSLDCRNGSLSAIWTAERDSEPTEVRYGHVKRWSIPALKSDAANALLGKILPFAQRMVDGYDAEYMDGNTAAWFSDDAVDADRDIAQLCKGADDEDDHVSAWEAGMYLEGIGNADAQRKELGIDAETTDIQLEAIAAQLRAEAERDGIDILDGLDDYLDRLQREACEATESET